MTLLPPGIEVAVVWSAESAAGLRARTTVVAVSRRLVWHHPRPRINDLASGCVARTPTPTYNRCPPSIGTGAPGASILLAVAHHSPAESHGRAASL